MAKHLRILLLIALIVVPIVFYRSLNRDSDRSAIGLALNGNDNESKEVEIALIFDDLGQSLNELKALYSLDIPLTVSVIPNLKFSKNIAHIASRCGFSVLIHLPFEPKDSKYYKTKNKVKFISADLSTREIKSLLREYLNSLRIAIGVNNHMGSRATEDEDLMRLVLARIKKKGLIFIDSRTSSGSVAYKIARQEDLVCGFNEGFFDSLDDPVKMEERFDELLEIAREKGKIIIIAHPYKKTIDLLEKRLPLLKNEIKFITIKDYFDI